ncbi:hypothetical protein ACLOJK_005532 [Asimina triloba]
MDNLFSPTLSHFIVVILPLLLSWCCGNPLNWGCFVDTIVDGVAVDVGHARSSPLPAVDCRRLRLPAAVVVRSRRRRRRGLLPLSSAAAARTCLAVIHTLPRRHPYLPRRHPPLLPHDSPEKTKTRCRRWRCDRRRAAVEVDRHSLPYCHVVKRFRSTVSGFAGGGSDGS